MKIDTQAASLYREYDYYVSRIITVLFSIKVHPSKGHTDRNLGDDSTVYEGVSFSRLSLHTQGSLTLDA